MEYLNKETGEILSLDEAIGLYKSGTSVLVSQDGVYIEWVADKKR